MENYMQKTPKPQTITKTSSSLPEEYIDTIQYNIETVSRYYQANAELMWRSLLMLSKLLECQSQKQQ